MACDSCNMISIQGVPCHETGCPDAWRDKPIECEDCGFEFIPEDRNMTRCDGCECEYQDSHCYSDGMIGEYDEEFADYQYDYPETDLWYEC